MEMWQFTVFLSLIVVVGFSAARELPPKVQVYSRDPGFYGKPNTLICHASGFHPPAISIDLLSGDTVIPETKQTDLAFEENWSYHLTKHAPFTPNKGHRFACRVTHMGKTKVYSWEPDM
ncbi:beta-2-microglobulin-like [Echeneis naucrates]|uniref:Beta-2-microglobulin n=1 Tax=Echeneis naucrates TaxID=173247 RepID=A0A665W8D2_ECHNA|nr:beta-2-microglobulin-like [Echeneis naucrates]